jgi:hypothetical protein
MARTTTTNGHAADGDTFATARSPQRTSQQAASPTFIAWLTRVARQERDPQMRRWLGRLLVGDQAMPPAPPSLDDRRDARAHDRHREVP